MSKKPLEIRIDLDKKCKRCGESGATPSGYCMGCVAKGIADGHFDHIIKPIKDAVKSARRSKMSKKEKDVVHTTHEPHTLPCKLNEKDKAEAAEQLATAIQQGESLELERKSVLGDLTKRKGNLVERIHNLTINVKDGIVMRLVDCELELNHTKLSATLVRTDIDEVIDERPMTQEEKQMNLDDEFAD